MITEEQQSQAIQLLHQVWVTVDYFDHNGTLSTQIQDLLKRLDRPIEVRRINKELRR